MMNLWRATGRHWVAIMIGTFIMIAPLDGMWVDASTRQPSLKPVVALIVCALAFLCALSTSARLFIGFIDYAAPRRPDRCAACGYDLRASPDRCPECGTPVAK